MSDNFKSLLIAHHLPCSLIVLQNEDERKETKAALKTSKLREGAVGDEMVIGAEGMGAKVETTAFNLRTGKASRKGGSPFSPPARLPNCRPKCPNETGRN
jgi:hypothetical protein